MLGNPGVAAGHVEHVLVKIGQRPFPLHASAKAGFGQFAAAQLANPAQDFGLFLGKMLFEPGFKKFGDAVG